MGRLKIKWTVPTLAIIAVALAVALAVKSWPHSDPQKGKVPPQIAKTSDSLKVTRPEFGARRDSVLRVVVVDTIRAARAERAAKAAELKAEGFRKAADSIAALARAQGDSSFLWKFAYDNRTNEAEHLQFSLDSTKSALASERSARVSVEFLRGDAERRRKIAEETTIPGLERAIAALEKPCRIVGPIRCPSRTVTAVLAVTTTALVAATVAK